MSTNDRIFSKTRSSDNKSQWYFVAREGVMGPYATRECAETMLAEFTERCRKFGLTGGRDPAEHRALGPMNGVGAPFHDEGG